MTIGSYTRDQRNISRRITDLQARIYAMENKLNDFMELKKKVKSLKQYKKELENIKQEHSRLEK